MPTARANGITMYYELHGTGKPLVVLHGAFGWAMTPPALARNRQLIAVELQGHGHTANIDRPLTVESMADDVAALIKHLKIERAVRIGELKKMYGEAGYVDAEDRLSVAAEAEAAEAAKVAAAEAAASQVPAPVMPTDPGSIAKQNLLKRIRMARAGVAGATGKLGNGDGSK